MITQKTAENICHCYKEIEAGKRLLKYMEELNQDNSLREYDHYLKSMRQVHIAKNERELVEANERARIELESDRIKGGPDSSDAF